MRLKSGIWVSAYLRRCRGEGIDALLRRRGAEEAGAVFVKVSRLDGTAEIFGPAPQSLIDEPGERLFMPLRAAPMPEADAEALLRRQIDFDSDLWIVEVESRDGRHFLDIAKA